MPAGAGGPGDVFARENPPDGGRGSRNSLWLPRRPCPEDRPPGRGPASACRLGSVPARPPLCAVRAPPLGPPPPHPPRSGGFDAHTWGCSDAPCARGKAQRGTSNRRATRDPTSRLTRQRRQAAGGRVRGASRRDRPDATSPIYERLSACSPLRLPKEASDFFKHAPVHRVVWASLSGVELDNEVAGKEILKCAHNVFRRALDPALLQPPRGDPLPCVFRIGMAREVLKDGECHP